MTLSRLKPNPEEPNVSRLAELVSAVERRLLSSGRTTGWQPDHRSWPETLALTHSIEHDAGWLQFVVNRGRSFEYQKMFLFAPELAFAAVKDNVEVRPFRGAFWSYTLNHAVNDAMRARFKRLGSDVPSSDSDSHELARLAWHARPFRL